MNITSEGQFGLSNNPSGGYAYLQHASQWDYSLNPDTNDGLGMSGSQEDSNNVLYEKLEGQENAPPFPKRLTIGYNFSSGLRGFGAETQPHSNLFVLSGIEIKMLGDTQPIYIKDW